MNPLGFLFSNATETPVPKQTVAAALNTTAVAGIASTFLETTIPGFSIVSRILSEYFHIDISLYITYVVIVLAGWTALGFVFERIMFYFSDWFVATAEIQYNDDLYNYLMYWVARHQISKKTHKFIAGTKTGQSWSYDSEEEDNDDMDLDLDDDDEITEEALRSLRVSQRVRPLKFTPSRGSTHYFWYQGRLIKFERIQERPDGSMWRGQSNENVYLSCFGRSTSVIKALLAEAQTAYVERDGSKTVIFRGTKYSGGDGISWVRCMARPPRPMDTVVLDEEQKKLILSDMKEYLHPKTKRWYSDRGIPYRRGYLLHGPPGTGKSSLCFALAGVLHLPIYVCNLNSKAITDDSLSDLFRELPERSIVLLEDIDAAGLQVEKRGDQGTARSQTFQVDDEDSFEPKPLSRANTGISIKVGQEKPSSDVLNKGISFSAFLNIIDGVASAEGRILIMTTNHIEKLDPALLRPGRCDLKIHFNYASSDMIKGLFLAIYGEKSFTNKKGEKRKAKSKHGKTDAELAELADKFAAQLPGDTLSPAEIQGYLLKHKMDPEAAVTGTDDWLSTKALESAMRSY